MGALAAEGQVHALPARLPNSVPRSAEMWHTGMEGGLESRIPSSTRPQISPSIRPRTVCTLSKSVLVATLADRSYARCRERTARQGADNARRRDRCRADHLIGVSRSVRYRCYGGPLQVGATAGACVAMVARKNGHQYDAIGEYTSSSCHSDGRYQSLSLSRRPHRHMEPTGGAATVVYLGIGCCGSISSHRGPDLRRDRHGDRHHGQRQEISAWRSWAAPMSIAKDHSWGDHTDSYHGRQAHATVETDLVPKLVGGVDVYQHIRALWTRCLPSA